MKRQDFRMFIDNLKIPFSKIDSLLDVKYIDLINYIGGKDVEKAAAIDKKIKAGIEKLKILDKEYNEN